MPATWYLAKLVTDLFRNEPRNIGLLVQGERGSAARFVGRDLDGSIRKRSIPRSIDSDVYVSWVEYYARHAARESLDETIARRRHHLDPIYIERRGVVGSDVSDDELGELVNELYPSLVGDHDALAATPDLRGAVDRLIHSLPDQFEPNFELAVEDREINHVVHFDWKFRGERVAAIDNLALGQRQQEQTTNDLLFRITLAQRSGLDSFVALHLPPANDSAEEQLQRVNHYAHTIDVTIPTARRDLAAALGVTEIGQQGTPV